MKIDFKGQKFLTFLTETPLEYFLLKETFHVHSEYSTEFSDYCSDNDINNAFQSDKIVGTNIKVGIYCEDHKAYELILKFYKDNQYRQFNRPDQQSYNF